MNASRAASILLCLWLLALPLATLAGAAVIDPMGLLGAEVGASLEKDLSNIGADNIMVLVTRTAPEGAAAMAELAFKSQNLKPSQALIVIVIQEHTAGAALGDSYLQRGVTPARAAELVAKFYVPQAGRDRINDGVVALVRELKYARVLGPIPGRTPVPYTPPPAWEGHEVGLGALGIVLGVIASAIGWRVRWRRSWKRLTKARLIDLKGHQGGLVSRLRELKEPADRAVERGGTAAALGQAVLDAREGLKREDRAITECLEGAATELAARRVAEAAALLDRADDLTFAFEATLVGLRTALLGLERAEVGLAADIETVATRLARRETVRKVVEPVPAAHLAEARQLAEQGNPLGAREQLAAAATLIAGTDPDDRIAALAIAPTAVPTLAAALLARWQTYQAGLPNEPAGPLREQRRGRLEEIGKLLLAPKVDLARVGALLDALAHMDRIRGKAAENREGNAAS